MNQGLLYICIEESLIELVSTVGDRILPVGWLETVDNMEAYLGKQIET